jgi:hypothetical protein
MSWLAGTSPTIGAVATQSIGTAAVFGELGPTHALAGVTLDEAPITITDARTARIENPPRNFFRLPIAIPQEEKTLPPVTTRVLKS